MILALIVYVRIAQVSPLYESVPPKLYGGTERVVSYLTEELVRQGHEVTLFASGDSVTRARLIAVCPESLRLSRTVHDSLPCHYIALEQVFRRRDEFDIVHFHLDYLHYPLSRRHQVAQVTTLHGRLDLPELVDLYAEFNDMPVVSISDAQREPLPHALWMATVHHGLPADLYAPGDGSGGYLAFLGRISPEKGAAEAVAIAARAGRRLKIAAKIDAVDQEYYDREIAPLMSAPHVDFIGEIGEADKERFLGGALALVSPVEWPEPFGLVLIEALACGTPVIAFDRGSIPEIVEDGRTGFVVRNVEEAVAAAARLPAVSRTVCRDAFDSRFTAARMAEDYLGVYKRLLRDRDPDPTAMLMTS